VSVVSDSTLRRYLDRHVVIEPLDDNAITPVGYDFSVGNFVYILGKGPITPKDGVYVIPKRSTALIITKEALWVSMKIAGTFHSKVSLVSKGLSHISTTLDPGWFGPLLIATTNQNDHDFELAENTQFVTLVMYKVLHRAGRPHRKPPFRQDILKDLLTKTDQYVMKMQDVLELQNALKIFEERVRKATQALGPRIAEKVISGYWRRIVEWVVSAVLFTIAGLVFFYFGQYWPKIADICCQGLAYGKEVLTIQWAILTTLIGTGLFLIYKSWR
jgi:deoxycytidine triphosphate deaminase